MSKKFNFFPYHWNKFKCPFALRNLEKSTCFCGDDYSTCRYFVRYDFEKKPAFGFECWLVCSHDLELSLNF